MARGAAASGNGTMMHQLTAAVFLATIALVVLPMGSEVAAAEIQVHVDSKATWAGGSTAQLEKRLVSVFRNVSAAHSTETYYSYAHPTKPDGSTTLTFVMEFPSQKKVSG
jgi:hypothetical protein